MRWCEEIGQKMMEAARKMDLDNASIEWEKSRLKSKRTRILKQHREGYIDDKEFQVEIAVVELKLS